MKDELNYKNCDEIGEDLLHDASNFRGECDSYYRPGNRPELTTLLMDLYKKGTKITISGARTGLTGGCVPEGGALISTEKLSEIKSFDEEEAIINCGPGVLLVDLQKYLRERGYFFPADPTETLCTVGGVVANNSSGARSYKYGPARNFVMGLNITIPDCGFTTLKRGEVVERGGYFTFTVWKTILNLPAPKITPPPVKNAAGYYFKPGCDLIDLLVGSEGTLCVFSGVKLKVLPLPEKLLSCVAFFGSEEGALSFISEARRKDPETRRPGDPETRKPLDPETRRPGDPETRRPEDPETRRPGDVRALEFFDGNSLEFLRGDFPKVPEGKGAAVWFEVETTNDDFDNVVDEWAERLEKAGVSLDEVWMPVDPAGIEEIKRFRHAVSWKVSEYIKRKGLRKLGTDTAVPVEAFDEYYNSAIGLVKDAGIKYVAYGHFGDCHLHLNMLPRDDSEYLRGKEIYLELCRRAVNAGGTVSAEHGIGKLKKEYLKLMYGEEGISEMRKVKQYLDPKFLLNRGNLFD